VAEASRVTFSCAAPWQVDGQMLPLPLPYFMSPVCGAACVIDMLTVNVIGGTTDTGDGMCVRCVCVCGAWR